MSPNPSEGRDDEELEATQQELGSQQAGHSERAKIADHRYFRVYMPDSCHPHRQRPAEQSPGHHGRPAAPLADRGHRAVRVRARARSRSTRSMPKGSGATSSRSQPTPSSSWTGCQSPLVDRLEGLAPAVAIEQRNPVVSSRSTVGTATEVYDYLRLLWARLGKTWCRGCGAPVRRDTPQSATDHILATIPPDSRFQVVFPLPTSARVTASPRGYRRASARPPA